MKPSGSTYPCFVATRIHADLGEIPTKLDTLVDWCEQALTYANCVIVATDDVLFDTVHDLLQPLDSLIHPLLISPWRGVAVPLNAIIAEATLLGGKSLLLQSIEVQTNAINIYRLHAQLHSDTLVVGAKLLDIHGENTGLQPLNGLNSPWNTLALWDLHKLNIVGFLGLSNGFLNAVPAGIEEVATISLLQHMYPDTAQSKLITLSHLHWDQSWDSPERFNYHQQKIVTKLERAEIQLKHLPYPRGRFKMKKAKKVTRIAYSDDLNQAKYDALNEIAKRCGSIRTEVWRNYGSVGGLYARFRPVRQGWHDGKRIKNLPRRLWEPTLNDSLDDIKANREAAKEKVIRHIFKNIDDNEKRKELFKKLKNDSVWVNDDYVRRLMRKYWKHGKNHTFNQIVLDPGCYKCFQHNGKNYIKVISLVKCKRIAIPIGTNYPISGRIRLILRDGGVEIHYTIDNVDDRVCGSQKIGIDKGYTEAFVDTEGEFHGKGLGEILSKESDYLKKKYKRRNKIKAVLGKVEQKNPKKAKRIIKKNLGRKKLNRRKHQHQARVKTIVFTATNRVVDKAKTIVCEDLTKTFRSKSNYGKNTNRRLSGWVKGLMAKAIDIVASRRGSRVVQVNAAYTSQMCSKCGCHAAINVKARLDDKEIHRWLPFHKVKQILLKRCRQSDETGHPVV